MTLENSKSYGLRERNQTVQDLARSRLNGPTPHQAPQRERTTQAQVPGSGRTPRSRRKRWTDLLSPDRNMGVPQLMMILEPNVVWDHTNAYSLLLGKIIESSYCPGEFFEGWHKAGRLANGVYEGCYWELIGDCDEMIEMLKKMARAPPLLAEPTLNLPDGPDLPKWEDFKPLLQALPSAPQLPQLKLPTFRAPLLDTEVPFIEPSYVPLPEVPTTAKEEAVPMFFTPELAKVEAFEAAEYVQPEPPAGAEQPHAPTVGKAQHGHDWTGQRPFVVAAPTYVEPTQLDILQFQHPPRDLPKLPLMEDLQLDHPDLDLDPIPRLELAWECGPDPEPSYASIATPARLLSRPGSPLRSRANSRPVSAVAGRAPAEPPAAPPPAAWSPMGPSARSSGSGARAAEPAAAAVWEELVDVDAGKPRLWLNFEKPFAELPPIFMPPEPELHVVNGREPQQEDFPHEALEEEPGFRVPAARAPPAWDPPPQRLPRWMPPCEPRPVGFLRGTAPVLIIDVSGTMNPRMNGRFKDVKACVCELLEPSGELATAAGAFDVVAFCSGAWSWSATFASRMELLASSQTFYSGRQAGGRPRPGSSRVPEKTKAGARLQPTEPELLADAQNWVSKWPDAVGHTSMLAAFMTADEHWSADCWYVFSDGLADDPSLCTQFLEARIRHGQKVPVIHAVGFFPDGTPENFEGRRYLQLLSEMTGGSFQEYDRNLQRIFQEGTGFVRYNMQGESPEDRVEREWAEMQVRAERKKNIALGVAERFEVTIARVAVLHKQTRWQVCLQEFEAGIADMRAEYEACLAEVNASNASLVERSRAEYEEAVAGIRGRNGERLAAARAAFEDAHAEWRRVYDDAAAEWRQHKALLEAQRAEAMAALNSSRGPSSRASSRPGSARSRPASRPASARPVSAARRPPLPQPQAYLAPSGDSAPPRPQSASRQPLPRPQSGRMAQPGLPPAAKLPATREDGPWSATQLGTDPATATEATDPAPAIEATEAGSDDGIIQEEGDDDVGELGELPALELEDSQELKRQMFPEEVVQALDAENSAALETIRDEWQRLLTDTDARNRKKLDIIHKNKDVVDKYVEDVVAAYAQGFVMDVLRGACVRTAANQLTAAAAQAAHAAAVAAVDERNERTARLHTAEVEEKVLKEEQYTKAVERWREKREELAQQYEQDIATAKKNHAENVARAQKEWHMKKEEMDAVNDMCIKDAEERHGKLLDNIKALNLKHRAEFEECIKARKAVETENQTRLAEARVQHKIRLDLLQQENTARLAAAQSEHQALCVRMVQEHETAKEVAQQEHDELRAFLTQHNEALMTEARAKYQDALVQVQADFDELCTKIRRQLDLDLEHVRRHNKEIWPQVQVARLAQAELGRVQAFAEHIKFCANKFALGVNFLPNTPNFDRVVEMQALIESLQCAFPDYPSDSYPWPDHERKGQPGTGWVASPQPRSLNIKDPAIEISRLAMGKSRNGSASSSRGPSSGATSPRPGSPSRTPQPSTFFTSMAEQSETVLGGGAGAARPATAMARQSRPGAGGLPASRPGSAGAQQQRPSSTGRRPMSAQGAAGQAETVGRVGAGAGARRPESAGRMRFSNLVQSEGGAPAGAWHRSQSSSLAEGAASPLAAAARPVSARAQAGQQPQQQWDRPKSAAALSRPPSGSRQQHLPARVAARLNSMHAALQSTQSVVRVAPGNSSGKPPLAGFMRDLPRLHYTEVDVKALDS